MEERHGVRGTVHDGIFFSEAAIPRASTIRHLQVEISRQNATLGEVKTKLAAQVRECGGTALASFKYGQRKHHWLDYLSFKWDTESWYGEGDAVRV